MRSTLGSEQIICVGPKDRQFFKGKRVFNVTSSSSDFCKDLSPMILGPIDLYRNFRSRTVENAWQYSKVYLEHDVNGLPNVDYFRWAIQGWSNPQGVRYPMGKGSRPLYSFWNDECLDYISARMKIYIPLYAKCAKKTSAIKELQKIYDSGDEIILFDYDGYITNNSLETLVLDHTKPLGHSFVIKMILKGLI